MGIADCGFWIAGFMHFAGILKGLQLPVYSLRSCGYQYFADIFLKSTANRKL
jgi:hypothetical protein